MEKSTAAGRQAASPKLAAQLHALPSLLLMLPRLLPRRRRFLFFFFFFFECPSRTIFLSPLASRAEAALPPLLLLANMPRIAKRRVGVPASNRARQVFQGLVKLGRSSACCCRTSFRPNEPEGHLFPLVSRENQFLRDTSAPHPRLKLNPSHLSQLNLRYV